MNMPMQRPMAGQSSAMNQTKLAGQMPFGQRRPNPMATPAEESKYQANSDMQRQANDLMAAKSAASMPQPSAMAQEKASPMASFNRPRMQGQSTPMESARYAQNAAMNKARPRTREDMYRQSLERRMQSQKY